MNVSRFLYDLLLVYVHKYIYIVGVHFYKLL